MAFYVTGVLERVTVQSREISPPMPIMPAEAITVGDAGGRKPELDNA